MTLEDVLSPALWGVVGSVVTGVLTYRATSKKSNIDLSIQQVGYVDSQIQLLLESYKYDLQCLREEVGALTTENQKLIKEIFELKNKITEMEMKQCYEQDYK